VYLRQGGARRGKQTADSAPAAPNAALVGDREKNKKSTISVTKINKINFVTIFCFLDTI
jgi:hypothetical protein